MLAFPVMIEEAARLAGMKVPDNIDLHHDPGLVKDEYPHWHVYCCLQLGRRITWGNQWHNAEIIAAIPIEELLLMHEEHFRALGFDP